MTQFIMKLFTGHFFFGSVTYILFSFAIKKLGIPFWTAFIRGVASHLMYTVYNNRLSLEDRRNFTLQWNKDFTRTCFSDFNGLMIEHLKCRLFGTRRTLPFFSTRLSLEQSSSQELLATSLLWLLSWAVISWESGWSGRSTEMLKSVN